MTDLKKKPLVEAILELRWRVPQAQPGQQLALGDPHYQLLLGRFYDRLREKFPSHESLPSSQVPAGLFQHIVQHRFRVAPSAWPLVQIGSGILTLNATDSYTWESFKKQGVEVVEALYNAHPRPSELQVERISLRYLDAVPFAENTTPLIEFLKSKLKLTVELPPSVFDAVGIKPKPEAFQWQAKYSTKDGKLTLAAAVTLGMKESTPSVILDTSVDTASQETIPTLPDSFSSWIDDAHEVGSSWFKELTKGELYESFEPEKPVN